MQLVTPDLQEIVRGLLARCAAPGRPRVLGVSGFGGSGKSTLAERLRQALDGSAVVPGDEFLNSRPPRGRSDGWDVMDRDRLRRQVLLPARDGKTVRYQEWDPATGAPGPWVELGRPGM